MVVPFSNQEVYLVVKSLSSDKDPGPDGFNTNLIKKCCPIICIDFYNLCSAFYNGHVCLQSINGSHITWVPKHDNVVKVKDFRPVSLLKTTVKILQKI